MTDTEEALCTLARLLGDAMERYDEAMEQVTYWKELCGKEAVRANRAEARALAAGNQPNGGGNE